MDERTKSFSSQEKSSFITFRLGGLGCGAILNCRPWSGKDRTVAGEGGFWVVVSASNYWGVVAILADLTTKSFSIIQNA